MFNYNPFLLEEKLRIKKENQIRLDQFPFLFNYIFLVNQTELGYNYDPIKNIIRKHQTLKKNSILTHKTQNIRIKQQPKQIQKNLKDKSLRYGLPLENRVAEEEAEKERESSEEILREAMVLKTRHSQHLLYVSHFDRQFRTNQTQSI